MRSTFNFTKMALLNIFDLAEGEENNRFPLGTVHMWEQLGLVVRASERAKKGQPPSESLSLLLACNLVHT